MVCHQVDPLGLTQVVEASQSYRKDLSSPILWKLLKSRQDLNFRERHLVIASSQSHGISNS
jgi:hypothetical protein